MIVTLCDRNNGGGGTCEVIMVTRWRRQLQLVEAHINNKGDELCY